MHANGLAVGLVWLLVAAPALAADNEPRLVNEELVVTQVDASGLPVDATLYSRVMARDYPAGQVRDPSSTTELTYVDRRGSPETDGNAVLIDIGGSGQTSVTTRAVFDKPLPVALHAQYEQGTEVIAPDEVESATGQMRITYTVTNTTAEDETIRYRDAAGRWTVDSKPVFAPFVGTVVVTLPDALTLLQAPNATRSTTSDGRTQLLWNLVLYPPMGNYQQDVQMLVSGDPLAVPSLSMQVIPVTADQSPVLGFSTDLLAASVKGNAELARGLEELNTSTTALAAGAADLSRGLRQVGQGTSLLSNQVNTALVPGSQDLAEGADDLARAQRQAAKGATKLANGQEKAAEGTQSAYKGAKSLEKGAAAFSDGLLSLYDGLQELLKPGSLPVARDSADQLAQAVLRLHDVIGTAGDPDIGFPPSQASTLIQAVRAAKKVSGVTTAGANSMHRTLKDIAAELSALVADSGQAAAQAGSAQAKANLVYQQACVVTPVLDAGQCATLQEAATDAGAASQQAGEVAWGIGTQTARVTQEAIAAAAITASLTGITGVLQALETALNQISVGLVSGSTASPGVYEGLQALTDGLTATINGLVKLSNGAAESVGGARDITAGSQDLTDGLSDLADGADDLADGADDLADGSADLADGTAQLADGSQQQAQGTAAVGDALVQVDEGVSSAGSGAQQLSQGARQLQQQGTQKVLNSVIKASQDPAFAKAYLKASERRAADALPYGAPAGGAGRVAYVYTMTGTQPSSSSGTLAAWGLVAVIVASAIAVAWRRLHPVANTAESPPGPEPEPAPIADNDWLFRPPGDQAH